MKRIYIIGILLLVLSSVLFLAACTTETTTSNQIQENQQVIENKNKTVNEPKLDDDQISPMNNTMGGMPPSQDREFDGERSDMDEMMVKMFEACEGLTEGDSCITEGPMGEEEGTCTLMDEELSCMREMPSDRDALPESR